jgi:hypothetical protein
VKPGHPDVIVAACRGGNSEIVRILLAYDSVDPSVNSDESLAEACASGNTEVVRLLLADPRIDPSDNGEQVTLSNACEERKFPEIVRVLLSDPRVEPSHPNVIVGACRGGNAEIVRMLLSYDSVDPSAEDDAGNDGLAEACGAGHTEVVRLLLADERVDPDRDDILLHACQRGFTEVVRLLLADPRVNPSITPQRANILATSVTLPFDSLVAQYRHDVPQLRVSVNHALDKAQLKQTAKNLTKIQTLEKHEYMNPNIANTIGTFAGQRNRSKTIANSLRNLKGTYYGPAPAPKRRTRKRT